MDLQSFLGNMMHPPILFFVIGLLAVFFKSDLEIPPQIAKFFTIYLLFDIGFKGGVELASSGMQAHVLKVMAACMAFSFAMPFLSFFILRTRLDAYNAGAIAATYGSVSAVTFATAVAFLETQQVRFGGYMVAGMAIMESPAIIAGLILIRQTVAKSHTEPAKAAQHEKAHSLRGVIRESLVNGSVFLLVGSLAVGYLTGHKGESELKPFINDIFKGMLSLYMLDMGLLAARRMGDLRKSGTFLALFALCYPVLIGSLGVLAASLLGLDKGDALLFTILAASASYIAVPAAMRMAVPQANMSLLLPMSLGITFSFNISLGIPLYYAMIQRFWA